MKKIPQYEKSSFAALREISADFYAFRDKLLALHKDICACKVWHLNLIFINKPEYIKHVLYDNHRNYIKMLRADILKKSFGEYSLIATNNYEEWKNQKKIMIPAFQASYYEIYSKVFTENCQAMLSRWEEYAKRGEPININDMMTELALKNLLQTLFGNISLDILPFSHLLRTLTSDIEEQSKSYFRLKWILPTPSRIRSEKNYNKVNEIVLNLLETRRASQKKENNLIDMLIGVYENESDRQLATERVLAQLVTMLGAGYETSVATLCYLWILLSQHPTVAQKLREEANSVLNGRNPTYNDLAKLPYTRAVVLETLRLYPPIAGLMRTAVAEDQIDGYRIPAKSIVSVGISSIHRRPDYWENPEGFNPERFLPNNFDSEKYLYTYLPFGAGPRVCIGRDFAITEISLILAMVIQKYDLYLPPHFKLRMQEAVVAMPQYDLKMRLKKISV